ncbi:MAG TPA: zf-HC2 domain-containing protein [Blastocatellia bacterium]|nr:zf-HC2 domain-containing protein [Blastocatellia bacterium]
MNCETCRTELEDFLYGELDAAQVAALNEHLSVCTDCRAVQVALEREKEIFAQYYEQNAIEPSDEMWQAIHVRIKPETAAGETSAAGWSEKFRNWLAPVFAPVLLRQVGFAALLILVSVGLTTLYFSTRKVDNNVAVTTPTPSPTPSPVAPEPKQQPTQSPTPAPNLRDSSKPQVASAKAPAPKAEAKQPLSPKLSEDVLLSQQIAKATREYQSAIKLLERTIAKRKTQLDEGTVKQFEGSLAMIDASIAASRDALRAHPNDPTAARFLLAAYSKKVELMQEIAMR